jgi:hypothetical protein
VFVVTPVPSLGLLGLMLSNVCGRESVGGE